ncbi:hypothetical protein [Mycetocola lacteus]|uniref:hypothetical protein n=1 Tax=Mycetocola lacteus TaxID=76637 RepID=UPI0011C38A9C|nr:hypothetical protein [Mycetocola lacteus]
MVSFVEGALTNMKGEMLDNTEISVGVDSKALSAQLVKILDDLPSIGEIVEHSGVSVDVARRYRNAMDEVLHRVANAVSNSASEFEKFSKNVEGAISALQDADADAEERARQLFSTMSESTGSAGSTLPLAKSSSNRSIPSSGSNAGAGRAIGSAGTETENE